MVEEFKTAIRNYGLVPPSHIEPGKWIRFPGRGKGPKDTAGHCFLFPDLLGGLYGDFRAGDGNGNGYQKWRADRVQEFSEAERIDFDKMIREAQAKAEKEQAAMYKEKAGYARNFIAGLGEASDRQKYLKTKKVKVYGPLKKHKQALILPLYNEKNEITTYQEIFPDGRKNFLAGGQKGGSAFPIPGSKEIVYLCEGYSTGATIHVLTGSLVIVCVDAGNMKKVAVWASERYEHIVVAADNDHHHQSEWIANGKKGIDPGPGGVGIRIAKEICQKHSNIEYVAPPAIEEAEKGTDWNDYFLEFGKEDTKKLLCPGYQKRLSVEDIKRESENKTLNIPDSLWKDKGLISLGMDAARKLSGISINQYLFPSILIMISTAISEKIRCMQSYPSCCFVKIGPTSTGKTEIDSVLNEVVKPFFRAEDSEGKIDNSFYGVTEFASGPGLMKAMAKKGHRLIALDEITFMFSNSINQSKIDSVTSGKIQAILELSTIAGRRYEKPYSDSGSSVVINNACLNLIGNATPLVFKALSLDDFQSGLIQRFDFFVFDGKVPYRQTSDINSTLGKDFAKALKCLKDAEKPDGTYDLIQNDSVNIGIEKDARKMLEDYSKVVIDDINSENDEGLRGIISRKYNAALKYALIHIGAMRNKTDIFEPVSVQDLEYGIQVADLLAEWKLNVLTDKVSAGGFHSLCNTFLEGAKSAVRAKLPPTWNVISNRRKALRNLNKREFDDILEALIRQRLITIDSSGKAETYYPLEKNKE